MKKLHNIIFSQVLLLLTISLIVNKAFYTHFHVLSNGRIVVHAHPYSKKQDTSKQTNHTHTKLAFYFIDQFNRYDDVPVNFQNFEFVVGSSNIGYQIFNTSFVNSSPFEFVDKRGPPTILS